MKRYNFGSFIIDFAWYKCMASISHKGLCVVFKFHSNPKRLNEFAINSLLFFFCLTFECSLNFYLMNAWTLPNATLMSVEKPSHQTVFQLRFTCSISDLIPFISCKFGSLFQTCSHFGENVTVLERWIWGWASLWWKAWRNVANCRPKDLFHQESIKTGKSNKPKHKLYSHQCRFLARRKFYQFIIWENPSGCLNLICMSLQFVEENDAKNGGEQQSNTAVQIEDDGPSETFKDEESKVNRTTLLLDFFRLFVEICY